MKTFFLLITSFIFSTIHAQKYTFGSMTLANKTVNSTGNIIISDSNVVISTQLDSSVSVQRYKIKDVNFNKDKLELGDAKNTHTLYILPKKGKSGDYKYNYILMLELVFGENNKIKIYYYCLKGTE